MRTPFPGLEVEVQSTHVDMFGHLNHTRYLEYMEWSRFAWSAYSGFPIDEMIVRARVGPAILRVNIQYRRECRLGDRLHVSVEPHGRRRAIGLVNQVITDVRTGERVCEAELAFVMLNLDSRKAAPLPQAFLDLLPAAG